MRSANPSIGSSPTKKLESNSNHSIPQFEFYATLAWNLLRTDGVVFVSIDEKEVQHFRIVANDLFGEENFVAIKVETSVA